MYYKGTAFCHHEFAIQYLKEQNIEVNEDEKDYLVNNYNWCAYAHYLNGEVSVSQSRRKLTKEQMEALLNLFKLNDDNLKALDYLR